MPRNPPPLLVLKSDRTEVSSDRFVDAEPTGRLEMEAETGVEPNNRGQLASNTYCNGAAKGAGQIDRAR